MEASPCKLQKIQCSVLFRSMWTFLMVENKGTFCRIIPDLCFPNRTFLHIRKENFSSTLLWSVFGVLRIKLTQVRSAREKIVYSLTYMGAHKVAQRSGQKLELKYILIKAGVWGFKGQ